MIGYIWHVIKHKIAVQYFMTKIFKALMKRSRFHDCSKFRFNEAKRFKKIYKQMGDTEYNSPEYEKQLDFLGSALHNHYLRNSHHPQHWVDCNEMSIIDLIEMVCDWKAATILNKNSTLQESYLKNVKRFHFNPQNDVVIAKIVEYLSPTE